MADDAQESGPADAGQEDPALVAIEAVWEAYRAGDVTRGVALGRAAVDEHADHGEAWFALGCCLERGGDLLAADRCFARAARARIDPQPSPCRVSWARFRRIVDEAVQALPERLRKVLLGEVTVVLADYAEPDLLTEHADPELLGLFSGVARGDRLTSAPGTLSPRIHVFRRAHEHACSDLRDLADEVRKTLYHELGHYIGFDEDGLDELGMG